MALIGAAGRQPARGRVRGDGRRGGSGIRPQLKAETPSRWRQLIAGGYVTPYELDEFYALLQDDTFRDLAPALVQSWGRK